MYQKTDSRKTIPSNRETICTKMKVNALMNYFLHEAEESLKSVDNNKIVKKILTSNEHQLSDDINASFLTLSDYHHNIVHTHTQLETQKGVTRTALMNDEVLSKRIYKDPYQPAILH